MQVVEIRLFEMSDPVVAVATIVGLMGIVAFVAAAVMRARSDRRWDRVLLGSAVVVVAAFAVLLAYTWLASPAPPNP